MSHVRRAIVEPMKLPIYMDHHATTPVDPRVLEAMLPYFTQTFGNAASRNHVFGWEAEAAVDEARHQIASAMNASDKEIVFTSGATESDDLAILGAARMYRQKGNHVVTGRTEHRAVLDTCEALEKEGFEVTYLPADRFGRITADQVRDAIRERTILVTLMLANNEVGTIHPIAEMAAVCKEGGILFHTDAVQGFGKIPFDVEAMRVDLASVTAHKIYGPKGVRRSCAPSPRRGQPASLRRRRGSCRSPGRHLCGREFPSPCRRPPSRRSDGSSRPRCWRASG